MSVRVQRSFDLLCAFLDRWQVVEGFAEARDSVDRRTPVGEPGKVVDEPSHRPLHLTESAGHHNQAAEREAAAEIGWRRDQDRPTSQVRPEPINA